MPRLELQHLLKPTTSPEQEILLNHFYQQFDYSAAGINRHIVNVEPIWYAGLIAGTEFLTYAATKLYICFYCIGSSNATIVNAAGSNIIFYNEANAAQNYTSNVIPAWESALAAWRHFNNPAKIENIYFSRIAMAIFNTFVFNGYRITLD